VIPRSAQTRFAGLLQVFPQPRTQFAFLNTRSAPFGDVRARRALAYAVDRAQIVRLEGGALSGAPTCQLVPPGAAAYRRYCPYTREASSSGAWLGPDLVRARTLVDESGTAGDRVVVRTAGRFEVVGRAVARVLDRLGYRASLMIVPDVKFFTTTVSPK